MSHLILHLLVPSNRGTQPPPASCADLSRPRCAPARVGETHLVFSELQPRKHASPPEGVLAESEENPGLIREHCHPRSLAGTVPKRARPARARSCAGA